MKFAPKIALFFLASVFATSFSIAGPTDGITHHGNYPATTVHQPQQAQGATGKSSSYGAIKLQHNQHIAAYLPKDIRSYQSLGFGCDEYGQQITSDNTNGCLDYVSASTHTKWRVRFGRAGTAEKVFKMDAKAAPALHVEFAKGDIYNE